MYLKSENLINLVNTIKQLRLLHGGRQSQRPVIVLYLFIALTKVVFVQQKRPFNLGKNQYSPYRHAIMAVETKQCVQTHFVLLNR